LPSQFAVVIDAPNHHPLLCGKIPPNEAIQLELLPPPDQHLGWWHRLTQIHFHDCTRGEGIRIGVIDTGCSSGLSQLGHVQRKGAFQDMRLDQTDLGLDGHGHGSAVMSLLGSRPTEDHHYAGIAPGVEILSVKLFEHRSPSGSTDSQAEIAEAVEYLASEGAHLINCSFECDESDQSVEQSLQFAHDQGVLCLCAAGNHGGLVSYPARSPLAVAVAALGDLDRLPATSFLRTTAPEREETNLWKNSLFVPRFTARGKELCCTAPGVGVFAVSLPTDQQPEACRAVIGTSFSTPIVCGLLAAELQKDPQYRSMPANKDRTEHARKTLMRMCKDLGFPRELQGSGLPVLRDAH